MPRYNLFRKLVILHVIMLVPIVLLYFYSNKTSTNVLATELTQSNTNQLTFFQDQINTNIGLLSLWPNLLLQDPDISNLKDIWTYEPYLNLEKINLVKRIQSKLNIQQSSTDLSSRILIYNPAMQRVISADDVRSFDYQELEADLQIGGWQVEPQDDGSYMFKLMSVSPFSHDLHNQPNLIIEVQFSSQNIEKMLDQFKQDGRRDPLYYRTDTGVIYNRTADRELAGQLIEKLDLDEAEPIENMIIDIDGAPYMVHMVYAAAIDWYLIDYMPLSEVMGPITQSNRLFYIAIISLLLMSSVTAYILYAQVQVPLKQLIRGFHRLKSEDYSIRLLPRGRDEFTFVFSRFNSMVEQMQELFQRVYLEKIHVREARLKQLQSQINPHFFYNCFSFISSMAKLKNTEAVVAMSQNLSRYYRYTTRQEKELATIAEEIEFVTNYLEIHKLRKKKLDYEVHISESLQRLQIPRLLIQPLIENAVIHGIETKSAIGLIRVAGRWDGEQVIIDVEDNGQGLDEVSMSKLERSLPQPMDEEMGCGLWNVHQRLLLRYGDQAGVRLSRSSLGGLMVSLKWRVKAQEQKVKGGARTHDRDLTG